jgi:Flp pilus assembly CpaF family ATPase
MIAQVHPLLAQAAGPLLPWLLGDGVTEIRCTSSGACFVLRFGQGKTREADIAPEDLDNFLAVLASHVGSEWRDSAPRLHAADPKLGFRVQASRPPVSPGIECVIRLHAKQVFPLDDFVQKRILTTQERDLLEGALQAQQTIVISGSTGSAKTSLLTALLLTLKDSPARILVLEDDPEIRIFAEEVTFQRCVPAGADTPAITMRDLCKDLLRYSPDIVVIGEFRDGAALDAMKAFQTGHQGLCTVHAESALATLPRLEQLILEVSATPQRALIAEAVDVICHMTRYGQGWKCTDILQVDGLAGETYLTHSLKTEGERSAHDDDNKNDGVAQRPGAASPERGPGARSSHGL